jgi:hypothetical protein
MDYPISFNVKNVNKNALNAITKDNNAYREIKKIWKIKKISFNLGLFI